MQRVQEMKTNSIMSFTAILALASSCQEVKEARKEVVEEMTGEHPEQEKVRDSEKMRKVRVELSGRSDSDLKGTALMTQHGKEVKVVVNLENAPAGKHGFHVHEKGDCSADDFTSAGGHFDPRGHEHGLPEEDDPRHLGDLGNVEVPETGKLKVEIVREGATLEKDADNSFLGRALILHAKADDGGQPTGNAGARIACGEIPEEPTMAGKATSMR